MIRISKCLVSRPLVYVHSDASEESPFFMLWIDFVSIPPKLVNLGVLAYVAPLERTYDKDL